MASIIIRILLLADDIALIANSPNELQLLTNELSSYCNANGLSISVPKSAQFTITYAREDPDLPGAPAAIITSNGATISEEKKAKYIGY